MRQAIFPNSSYRQGLLARHEAFLNLEPVERPLLGFWLGGYYPAEQFPTGTAGWRDGQELRPEDVSFAPFAADYENLFRLHQQADDDFFYVGSAYWGIPWLEAILGCPVFATGANCRAEACLVAAAAPPRLQIGQDPWFQALVRFTEELVEFSAGRFPVCPPLLRGPGDCASAMLGGMPFVMGFHDEPEQTARLLAHCSRTRLAVVRALQAVTPPWHETHAAGGYPSKLWCRRPVAYCQEDSAALLSPDLFRQFLLPLHREQCGAGDVNFIHLHSSCLYPVDILLENRCYDVLEINIDHPGGSSPSLPELLPTLKKIQAARVPLLLWGELTTGEWDTLRRELSPVGLSLQPIVRQAEEMRALREVLRKLCIRPRRACPAGAQVQEEEIPARKDLTSDRFARGKDVPASPRATTSYLRAFFRRNFGSGGASPPGAFLGIFRPSRD